MVTLDTAMRERNRALMSSALCGHIQMEDRKRMESTIRCRFF